MWGLLERSGENDGAAAPGGVRRTDGGDGVTGRGQRPFGWGPSAAILLVADVVAVAAVTRSPLSVAALVVVLIATGTLRTRLHLGVFDDDVHLVALAVVCTAAAVPFVGTDPSAVAVVAVGLVVARPLARWVAVRTVKRFRRRRPQDVLILGSGEVARLLHRTLRAHPEYGMAPRGFISDVDVDEDGVPRIGLGDAVEHVRRHGISTVICAFGPEQDVQLANLARILHRHPVRLAVVPRLFDLSPVRDHVWGIPVLMLPPPRVTDPRVRAVKRVVESSLATVALAVAAPVFALCAAAVAVSSPGPVLFRQRRVGEGGREFDLVKFRTMRVPEPTAGDAEGAAATAPAGWTVPDDPRRTRVGTVLRRTGLDELPQLLNVLRGDMGLVGPRPEQGVFVERFGRSVPGYRARLRAPAGLTGLAQVNGLRGDTSIEERVRFDNRYIDRYRTSVDLRLLVRTVGHLVKGEGSY